MDRTAHTEATQIAQMLRDQLEGEWDSPAGWCVRASRRLQRLLSEAGHSARLERISFHAGWDEDTLAETQISHTYVRLESDGGDLCLDITADQFNEYGHDFPRVHAFTPGGEPAYARRRAISTRT